jgi:hypothetical protein
LDFHAEARDHADSLCILEENTFDNQRRDSDVGRIPKPGVIIAAQPECAVTEQVPFRAL